MATEMRAPEAPGAYRRTVLFGALALCALALPALLVFIWWPGADMTTGDRIAAAITIGIVNCLPPLAWMAWALGEAGHGEVRQQRAFAVGRVLAAYLVLLNVLAPLAIGVDTATGWLLYVAGPVLALFGVAGAILWARRKRRREAPLPSPRDLLVNDAATRER